jgi:phospholipid/cholesterol/gamma-HCH transport system substrate-binding protein
VSPGEESVSPQIARSDGRFARLAAIGALALIVLAIVYLLVSGGGNNNHYKLLFQTGGQLVKGNQVLIGGVPVGTIDDVKLTDNGAAEVDISVDRPLHQGTTAVIRATSLSGIANRYISIQPGPDNAPELKSDQIISEVDTTSPVDLDQLFNTFRPPERKALQDIIQGSAAVYAGKGPQANETYKYLSPSLSATDRLLQELDRDENVFTDFLVNGASVVTAVAQRRNDLSALTSNANQALGAIAAENESFDRALVALPGALRQANTTFFNLRDALDDLDPLVNASKTGTKNLAPFLRQLKPVLTRSVPVFHDLNRALNRKGKANDLTDSMGDLPALQKRAADTIPTDIAAMQRSEPVLSFLRPYTPELMSAVAHLNQVTAYYDADGHFIRVNPAGMGVLDLAPAGCTNCNLLPANSATPFAAYGAFGGPNYDLFRRCPGGSTIPHPAPFPLNTSNPFSSPPSLGPPNGAPSAPNAPPDDCDATQVAPGP